jgi:hypothetical protein
VYNFQEEETRLISFKDRVKNLKKMLIVLSQYCYGGIKMKFYVTLFALIVVMILAAPALAGEEPYKAIAGDDNDDIVKNFYISAKLAQFLHPDTDYFNNECSKAIICPPGPIGLDCEPDGVCYRCPSKCRERFTADNVINQPEVCCVDSVNCPQDVKTALITKGNAGWYEWVIALPKKPEGELNIEIECGVLKPNSLALLGYEAIELCAAETGEKIDPGCTRKARSYLSPVALPQIEVTAHPGCQNEFIPFHLTAYRNPSNYAIPWRVSGGPLTLKNTNYLQVLDGSIGSRIALKACMEKTILVKWPVEGDINALGEMEWNLEAGDLIKVKMFVPTANTVDIYCSKYSVKIGGLGEPSTLLNDADCCRYHCNLQWPQLPLE